MASKWLWQISRLSRRLWLRATLISLLAIAAALASLAISPYLPSGLSAKIGADSVDNILTIIASSMLAVTTFSLSTMVSAYSAATTNVTPRATRLLLEDTTTQNVLAAFIGSFLYSIVAIVTLTMGAYGERGRVVLFAMTILVIALIVVTLLRWIDYLRGLGRVGETTAAVEQAAHDALSARKKQPLLGCAEGDPDMLPANAMPIFPTRIGYVQHIDVAALSDYCEELSARLFIAAVPGTFVDRGRPLAFCWGQQSAVDADRIFGAFTVGQDRSFDQDPRFGLCVLSEIAQRALSPAVNDPGTAIDVIGRAVRLLSDWAERDDDVPEVAHERLLVPALSSADLFDDILTPIARDGATSVEVQIRLQKAYAALARAGDGRFRSVAAAHSKEALERTRAVAGPVRDIERIASAAACVGA